MYKEILKLKLVVRLPLIANNNWSKSIIMNSTWSKLHLILKIGLLILILGSAPLLIVIGLDTIGLIDAGNAVGPGIVAVLSFYPSIILIIIGSILTYRQRTKAELL